MEFHPIAYPAVCSTNAVQFGFSCRHVEPMHVSLVVVACAIHGCYRRRFVRGSKGRCQSINVFKLWNLVELHLERLYILSLYVALGFHVEFRGGTQGHQQQNRRRRARACMGEGHVPRRVCAVRGSNQLLKYNLKVPVMEAVNGGHVC